VSAREARSAPPQDSPATPEPTTTYRIAHARLTGDDCETTENARRAPESTCGLRIRITVVDAAVEAVPCRSVEQFYSMTNSILALLALRIAVSLAVCDMR